MTDSEYEHASALRTAPSIFTGYGVSHCDTCRERLVRPGFPCFLCRSHVGLASKARTLRYTSGQLVTVAPGQLSEIGEDTLSSDEDTVHSLTPAVGASASVDSPSLGADSVPLPPPACSATVHAASTSPPALQQREERARARARVGLVGEARALGLAPVARVPPEDRPPEYRVALSGGRSWSPTSGLSRSAGAAMVLITLLVVLIIVVG